MKTHLIFVILLIFTISLASYRAFQVTNTIVEMHIKSQLRYILSEVRASIGKNTVLNLPERICGRVYEIGIKNNKLYGKCGDIILILDTPSIPGMVYKDSFCSGGKVRIVIEQKNGTKYLRVVG